MTAPQLIEIIRKDGTPIPCTCGQTGQHEKLTANDEQVTLSCPDCGRLWELDLDMFVTGFVSSRKYVLEMPTAKAGA